MYGDSKIVQNIAQDGLKTRESSFNSLGKIFVYKKRMNKKHCFNGNDQKDIEKGMVEFMPNSNYFLPLATIIGAKFWDWNASFTKT